MANLGVAVIGVGSMGRRHAENVRKFPEMRLVSVVDARADLARAVAEELGCDHWTADAEEALRRPDCDAAIIATAAHTHADLIAAAARSKRDVLCEKPLATTVADAWRAVAAMRAAGRRLQVGFMRRYDPAYVAAKRAIVAGQVGRPLLFTAVARDREPGPSQAGAGIFIDSGVHDYDLARWLLDDEVVAVSALATSAAGGEAVDTGLVTLRFAGGAVGTAELFTRAGYGYDIRTEVVGSAGTVRVGQAAEHPVALLLPSAVQTDFVGHYLDRFAVAYEREVRDWARRMQNGEEPLVTGDDGVRALQIALAAQEAAATGRWTAVEAPPGA